MKRILLLLSAFGFLLSAAAQPGVVGTSPVFGTGGGAGGSGGTFTNLALLTNIVSAVAVTPASATNIAAYQALIATNDLAGRYVTMDTGRSTNQTLVNWTNRYDWTTAGNGYVQNYLSGNNMMQNWILGAGPTGHKAFLMFSTDPSQYGDYASIIINSQHAGGNPATLGSEIQITSSGHYASGVGYGIGNKGHFQIGIGAANTNNGGVWSYRQLQRLTSPNIDTIPLDYSAADTWAVQAKSNGVLAFAAYPGFVAEALETNKTDYALNLVANLFTDWNGGWAGADTWRIDTIQKFGRFRYNSGTNILEWYGDIVASSNYIGNASGLTNANATTLFGSGTVPTARLGTGTANTTTYLRGDNTWATPAGGSGSAFNYTDFVGGTNTGDATLELRNTNGFAVVVVTNLSGGGSGVLLRSANGAANKYNQTDFETRQGNQIMRFFNTDADQADGGEWMYWNTGSGLMMGAAGGQTAIRGGGITTGVLQVDGSGVISSGGAGQTFLWGTNAATGEVTNRGIGAVSSYIATTNGAAVINANKTAGLLRVLNNGVSTVIDSNTITTGRLTVSGSAGVGGSATNFGRYTQLGQFGTAGWNGFMFDTNTGTFSISRSSDGATTASMAPSIASVGTFRGSAFDNSGQTASMNLGTANHIKWFVGTALGQTIGWANTTNVSFTTNLTAASVTGTNFLALATNYVAANFVPISGQVKFCASNRAVYAVSDTFTNLITGP